MIAGSRAKVYGVCWQDDTEPWGWEPRSLWRRRVDAEAELERQVEVDAAEIDSWLRSVHKAWDEKRRREIALRDARDALSIQEYKLR